MSARKFWIATSVPVVLALLSLRVSAAVLGGNQIEIAWTGGTPFGSVENNGEGLAEHTYLAPMGGTSFSTSPYASSTDMETSVQDTTISITNGGGGFAPQQWFEYLDVNDTLPDFTSMTFKLDPATTDASFNIAADLEVEPHGVALEFAEIPSGDAVTIDVAVPEPAALSVAAAAITLLGHRPRRSASHS